MNGWIDFQQLDWLAAVLLHSLWIGAALTAAVALITRLGKVREAQVRYLLGVGALAVFVVSVGILTVYLAPGSKPAETLVFAFDSSPAFSNEMAADDAFSWIAMIKTYSPVFLQTWFIGMIFLLLRMIGGYQYLVQVRRKATGHVPESWITSINRIQEQWKMRRPVDVLASNHVDMPMVFGHIKPVILLPVTMLSGLSQDQLEAIFAHELAHIRRNDYLVHLVQSIIEAVFFFNPFIWWMSKFINQEREQCCDDLALAYCSNPISYAQALSGLEEYRSMMLAMGLANGKKPLLERIRRIIEPEYTPGTSYRILLVAVLLSAGFLSFTVLQPAQELGWVPVKSDYAAVQDVVPVKAFARVPASHAASLVPSAIAPIAVVDTVPEIREREFYFDASDTIDWEDRLDLGDFDYDFDFEPFVVTVPDVQWESMMPVINADSVFIYMENVPEVDFEAFVVPDIEFGDFDFDYNFAPNLYSIDTTKLSEAEREELRQAREELQRAREEIRQLQREHKDRIREEMEKIRELQRKEMDIQREEIQRMQQELREQYGNQEAVISPEQQQEIMREMRRAQSAMREANREMAIRMTQESGRHQRQIREQMNRTRDARVRAELERARAYEERTRARSEMRRYRGFHDDVEAMLRRDGYLENDESLRKLKINEDTFRFNGKKVEDRDLDKYLKLYERRYGSLKGATYEYSE